MAKATLYLGTLSCKTTSGENSSDDVFVRIYVDNTLEHRWPANNETVDFDKYDNANTDIALNVDYASTVKIEVWDRDDKGNDDSTSNDKLAVYKLDRHSAPTGTLSDTTTNSTARYELEYRIITNRIPTVRVLGVKCEKESAGMNVKLAEAVFGAAEMCTEAAGVVIGKSPRPRAKAISKAFDAAGEVLGAIEGFIEFLGQAIEGKDDVYMLHVTGQSTHDPSARFFPKQTEAQTHKMAAGDEVNFEDRYGEYFRFPVDQADVTLEFREYDPVAASINIGALTIPRVTSDSDQRVNGPAVVQVANSYGKRGGEGAVYHICYAVGMDDWAKPANVDAQGGPYPPTSDTWSAWAKMAASSNITSAPALVSEGVGKLTCFARGPAGQVLVRATKDDGTWGAWSDLEGGIKGKPGAASWGPGRMDLVACGTDNALWHRARVDGQWRAWENLGGNITSGTALTSWGANRLDVFARGSNGQLLHRSYAGTWSAWEDLGGEIKDAPAAACWGPNRIDVVVRGMNDLLWHRAWNGSAWTGWAKISGGTICSTPTLTSRGAGRLDCFAQGPDGHVIHRVFQNNAWGDWYDLNNGGVIKDAPAAAGSGSNRLDVVAMGTDSQPWTTHWSA